MSDSDFHIHKRELQDTNYVEKVNDKTNAITHKLTPQKADDIYHQSSLEKSSGQKALPSAEEIRTNANGKQIRTPGFPQPSSKGEKAMSTILGSAAPVLSAATGTIAGTVSGTVSVTTAGTSAGTTSAGTSASTSASSAAGTTGASPVSPTGSASASSTYVDDNVQRIILFILSELSNIESSTQKIASISQARLTTEVATIGLLAADNTLKSDLASAQATLAAGIGTMVSGVLSGALSIISCVGSFRAIGSVATETATDVERSATAASGTAENLDKDAAAGAASLEKGLGESDLEKESPTDATDDDEVAAGGTPEKAAAKLRSNIEGDTPAESSTQADTEEADLRNEAAGKTPEGTPEAGAKQTPASRTAEADDKAETAKEAKVRKAKAKYLKDVSSTLQSFAQGFGQGIGQIESAVQAISAANDKVQASREQVIQALAQDAQQQIDSLVKKIDDLISTIREARRTMQTMYTDSRIFQ